MNSENILVNILLAFIFFFIGRFIVLQMGNIGYWIIGGLVIVIYVAWYFQGKFRSSTEKDD
jgi:hypothetical protein